MWRKKRLKPQIPISKNQSICYNPSWNLDFGFFNPNPFSIFQPQDNTLKNQKELSAHGY